MTTGNSWTMSFMVHILGKAATPMLVILVFALARRYAPVSANRIFDSVPPLDELDSRFATAQWVVALVMLAVAGLIFVVIHQSLVSVNQHFASLGGPAEFVFLPQTAIWYFLPGFAALTLTWDTTLWIWSFVGSPQTASLYEYWSNAKVGFDATRVLRIMALVIVLPVAILTVLALPEHDSLRAQEIHSRSYGISSTKVFRYSDAIAVGIIDGFRNRDGRLVERAGCVLYFSDGREWSSAKIGDFRPSVDLGLVNFLENKTRLHAMHAVTEEELTSLIRQASK